MILAVPEYASVPAAPEQWDRYFNLTDDNLYIQTVLTTDPSYPVWVEIAQGAAVREDMRRDISLTRSLYSAKDYQTFLDEIVAYIAEKWGADFNDFMSSDPAMMIAEYISAAFDQLSWYMDREVDEWYMELSRLIGNVARLARYLGYKPTPSVASSVDETITLTGGPYAFNIPLKAGHQFEGPNGLIFELPDDQTILAGETSKIVGLVQGQTFTEVFISDGTANQIFNLSQVPDGEYLAQQRTYLTVDLDEWTESDFLPYSAASEYEVVYLTSPPQLRFGNGVIGKIPAAGKEIRVSYMATRGNEGGFAISGTITKSKTTVVVNFQTIPLEVTNVYSASGGAPPESIDSIKAQAPRYFIAAERLVTQGDYDTLASGFSSISGAVAKANAVIVRGVSQDLELQALMDALTSDRTTLDAYMVAISQTQDDIQSMTGSTSVEDTIRYFTNAVNVLNTSIRSQLNLIDSNIVTVKGDITESDGYLDTAKTRLDFLPFKEVVGQGDGVAVVFNFTLAKKPIKEGSVTVFVDDKTPTKSATDGDCDATPGRLVATASPVFASTDVGKMVRIGGEYRQIQKFISATTIEYSGSRIYGTSLLVDVYPNAIVGYSDDVGAISGTGITGTVSQTSGALNITLSTAPEGIVGKYGVPIIVTYQYKDTSIQGIIDSALAASSSADTNVDTFGDIGNDIFTLAGSSDDEMTSINTACDDIDIETVTTKSLSSDARGIPVQIQNDIDALSEYIETMFSGDCKANVVRVSCLVFDENGFYTAPTVALKKDLKAYLDERKIRTVQNSVVGGDFDLVKVKLDVEVKLNSLFVFKTVREAIETAVDTMFKNRDYEQPLLRSEYYGVVKDIDGVEYCNVTISDTAYQNVLNTATPPSVNSAGNLFVSESEVITKWEVNITQIEE